MSRTTLFVLLVVAAIAGLPSLSIGLVNDDFVHRAAYLDRVPGYQLDRFQLYSFVDPRSPSHAQIRSQGSLPWYAPADLKLRFFRPLASALLALDVDLFAEIAWLAHLHSLAWYLLLVALVWRLYAQTLPPAAAVAAAFLYALSGVHTDAVGWLAARHLCVTAVLGMTALWFTMRAERSRSVSDRLLALLAFAIGLFVSEAALGMVGYVAAFVLLDRSRSLVQRMAVLVPWAVLSGGYLLFHRLAGYGTAHSGLYADPFGDPRRFLGELPERLGALITELTLGFPSIVYTLFSSVAPVMVIVACVVAALLWWRLRAVTAEDAALRRLLLAWALGALLSLLPFTPALITGRVLVLPGVGVSALFGVLLARGLSAVRNRSARRGHRLGAAAVVVLVVLLPGALGLLVRQLATRDLGRLARQTRQIVGDLPACKGDLLLVSSLGDPVLTTMLPAAALLLAPDRAAMSRSWHALSTAPAAHRIENITDAGFDLVVVGHRGRSFWESVFSKEIPGVGFEARLPAFAVQVVEATGDGPTRLRFSVPPPLRRPDRCFAVWTGERVQAIDVPAGGSVDVPFRPAPIVQQRPAR